MGFGWATKLSSLAVLFLFLVFSVIKIHILRDFESHFLCAWTLDLFLSQLFWLLFLRLFLLLLLLLLLMLLLIYVASGAAGACFDANCSINCRNQLTLRIRNAVAVGCCCCRCLLLLLLQLMQITRCCRWQQTTRGKCVRKSAGATTTATAAAGAAWAVATGHAQPLNARPINAA